MGEAERTPGTAVDERSPERIRAEIEATRGELGETVEALAAKTDVRGQAQARVDSAKDAAREKLASVSDATPDGVSAGGRQAATAVRENPAPAAAAGALAAGIAIGWLIGRR